MTSPSWSAKSYNSTFDNLSEYRFETVIVNERGEVIERRLCQSRLLTLDLGQGVVLEFAAIPGGFFQMGTAGRVGFDDERPPHIVRLAPFLMCKYLVTQEQWSALMGKRLPWRFRGAKLPVENVSWCDAGEFCQCVAQKTGQSCYLPSEAQWEYACRAGSTDAFAFGPTLTTDLANYVGDFVYRGEPKGIYRHTSTEGGSFPPNAFGLYDMHGNLWEWCADAWHPDYTGAPVDGGVWESQEKGANRVLRGGSWHEPPVNCRSATRLGQPPGDGEDLYGFRVALTI